MSKNKPKVDAHNDRKSATQIDKIRAWSCVWPDLRAKTNKRLSGDHPKTPKTTQRLSKNCLKRAGVSRERPKACQERPGSSQERPRSIPRCAQTLARDAKLSGGRCGIDSQCKMDLIHPFCRPACMLHRRLGAMHCSWHASIRWC